MRLCARQGFSANKAPLRYASVGQGASTNDRLSQTRPSIRRSDHRTSLELLASAPGTAEMFLMFELRRMECGRSGRPRRPAGLRACRHRSAPTPKQLLSLGERFRPYAPSSPAIAGEAVALSRGGTIQPAIDPGTEILARDVPSRGRWTAEMAKRLDVCRIGI